MMLSTSDLHLKFDIFLVVYAGRKQPASNRPRLHFGSGGRQTAALMSHRGAVAQLGERLICIQEVAGSIPTSSTSTSQETEVRRQESELLGFGRLGSPMGL